MNKDFLTITDFTTEEIKETFQLALDMKSKKSVPLPLKDKTVACIFLKPSLRTRVSFEVGIGQLGGKSLYISKEEIGLGKRESIYDAAKVLSRFVGMIMIRAFDHKKVEQLAKHAEVPVINGLTDLLHPCQVMGDMLTILEKKEKVEGLTIAYLGDGNNVANSWLNASTRFSFNLRIGTSPETKPNQDVLKNAQKIGLSQITVTFDPKEAIKDADVVYTDVWASMGQKDLSEQRRKLLKDFQVNDDLLKQAKSDCIVMHCLPANRGEEITDEVMDGPHSVVFDQAENRLHAQKAIMVKLLS
ncbi:MAG: ornithine carbamoyltransferase [candidate division Zixibacteria bacterium]|nr:ornithine carbamoyltransferase [candidate division Zixibacteria bacterium]